MARIVWSPQALDDLDAIRAFIAIDAPRAAQRFIQRVFKTAERLERFPLSGTMVPELRREKLREIRLKRYRIVYRVCDEDNVEIVTVYHGSRLLDLGLLSVD